MISLKSQRTHYILWIKCKYVIFLLYFFLKFFNEIDFGVYAQASGQTRFLLSWKIENLRFSGISKISWKKWFSLKISYMISFFYRAPAHNKLILWSGAKHSPPILFLGHPFGENRGFYEINGVTYQFSEISKNSSYPLI